eukprot:3207858-Alexandrium_andersonii.AAC.1
MASAGVVGHGAQLVEGVGHGAQLVGVGLWGVVGAGLGVALVHQPPLPPTRSLLILGRAHAAA